MTRLTAAEHGLRPHVDVRRSGERFRTRTDWLDSWHSFSFGEHYDPANTHFGLLVAHNHDVVVAGGGFDTHAHRDMEILTWVLEGALLHEDSTGHSGVIHPGLAQRMSAGTGIVHAERNDAWRLTGGPPHDRPVEFVQMWVLPGEPGAAPGYEQQDVTDRLAGGRLVVVASGMPEHADVAAVRIGQRDAALHVARLAPGQDVTLPEAPYAHVYVARGSVELEGAGELDHGDAARVTVAGGQRLLARRPAEVLVWQLRSGLPG